MSETRKQMVTRAGMEIPRRNCVDLHTPIERAISGAVQAVESGPAHPRMTDAVLWLVQALDAVADAEEALNPNLSLATPTPAADGEADFAAADSWARMFVGDTEPDTDSVDASVGNLCRAYLALRARPALERLLANPALPLSDEEGERLFDALQRIADAEPISEERLARIREGVLRRRGMVPALPADVQAADSIDVLARHATKRIKHIGREYTSFEICVAGRHDTLRSALAHLTREAR